MIQALERGLEILDALSENRTPMRCRAIASRLHVDASTAHRLLSTLVHRGYVEKDAQSKMYTLGVKPVKLARVLLSRMDVRSAARPHLEALAQETGECLHLAVAQGSQAVFVDRVSAVHRLTANTEVGEAEPLYCTAVGKALVATLPGDELRGLVPRRLRKYTPNTHSTARTVLADLAQSRQRGWTLDDEEYQRGIRCVATWILDFEESTVASIGLSAPKARLPLARAAQLGRILRQAAREISKKLGGGESEKGKNDA
ncbi:MAG: IclR family transcriptional regulator [Planctomycetota bacterium]